MSSDRPVSRGDQNRSQLLQLLKLLAVPAQLPALETQPIVPAVLAPGETASGRSSTESSSTETRSIGRLLIITPCSNCDVNRATRSTMPPTKLMNCQYCRYMPSETCLQIHNLA